MRRAHGLIVLVVLCFASAPMQAQRWEVSGLSGFVPSVDLDRRAPELNQIDIRGGYTWGLQTSRLFTPHWAAEALWTQQSSALEIGTIAGTGDLFTISIRQLQGNAVYRFGSADKHLQPFAFVGFGATFFHADEVPSETKFSLGLGGGAKYFPWRNVGIRGHVRYAPTNLNDRGSGDFCDPFGFCNGLLRQVEFAGGVVLRF